MTESNEWYLLYKSTNLIKRRLHRHKIKYQRLQLPESIKNATIIDLCCGTGEFGSIAAEKNPESLVIGVDSHLSSELRAQKTNFIFIQSSAYNIAIRGDSCDFLFCFHSLHHLGDVSSWQNLVKEMGRILKRGGKLYVIDHYPTLWLKIAVWLFKTPIVRLIPWMKDFQKQLSTEKEILNYWLEHWKEFLQLLAENGFTCRKFSKRLFFFYANYDKSN